MTEKQNMLIYTDENILAEAGFMSRNIIDREIKNRVYVNSLGAESLKQYLATEGFSFEGIHNLHTISRILEKFDIADVILNNIHIDVRVVFDENQIFIPQEHFQYSILPDIYVVLKLGQKFEYLECLGFFTPDKVNKNNKNDKYYFIEKNKLEDPEKLVNFIKNFESNVQKEISEAEILKGRELSIKLSDNDISDNEVKVLLNLLLSSDVLRDSVIEYDNFETLSHQAAHYIGDNVEGHYEEDNTEETQGLSNTEEMFSQEKEGQNHEDLESSNSEVNETDDESESVGADEGIEIPDDLSLDDIGEDLDLDLSDQIEILESEKDSDNITDDILSLGAGAAEGAVSDNAIKLAGLSGGASEEIIEKVVDDNLTQQYVNIDNIDKDKNDVATPMPDNIEDGVLLTEDMYEQDDNIIDANSANLEDLDIVDADNSYADVMAQEETFNIEDLPAAEGELIENFDHTATNLEDLPLKENEEYIENYDSPTNIEDLPMAESTDIIEDYDDMTNIEDLEIVDNNTKEKEDILSDDLATHDVNETSENIHDQEDSDAQIPELDEDILNEIENKQIFPEAYDEPSEDEQNEIFDLTDEEAWDKMEEINETFENSGENVDIIEDESNNSEIFDYGEPKSEESKDNEDDFSDFEIVQEDENNAQQNLVSFENIQMPTPEVNENVVSISDEDFHPGEIPIDVNDGSEEQNDVENLENLYNDSNNFDDQSGLNNSARISRKENSKPFPIALVIVGGLLTLVIVSVIGMSAMKMLKPVGDKNAVAPEVKTPKSPMPNSQNNSNNNQDMPNSNKNNVITMDNNKPKSVSEANVSTKHLPATSFYEVTKLSWEIPDYVSYSADFKNYFQSTGKSLKSALSSDLLLATEVVYSKQIRVSVTFDKSGVFKDSRIVMSSGSSQVDKIVLQSVNQTLRVLKAPSSIGNDQNTTVILKIYL